MTRHRSPFGTPAQADAPVVWLTGLSGSGKSTIGRARRRPSRIEGVAVGYIDGLIREVFPNTGFSRADRDACQAWAISPAGSRMVSAVRALISPHAEPATVRGCAAGSRSPRLDPIAEVSAATSRASTPR